MNQANSKKGSRIARLSAARLAAVQAVYQMKSSNQGASSIISEFKAHRFGKPLDDARMVLPDGPLFESIVRGTAERREDLRQLIDTFLSDQKRVEVKAAVSVEPLLDSILLCGGYELLAHYNIDAPVIISDYVELTHDFYDGGESRLVNAVLDNIRRAVRENQDRT